MYIWNDIVGHHEKRMKRLPRLHQIALAVACVDGALCRMEEYLEAYVPKKSLATVKQAVKTLWEFLAAPTQRKAAFSQKYIAELQAINPGEDDPVPALGWGQILDATLRVCDMASGEDPKELILDCLGYAYQGIMEMATRLESQGAKTTEKTVRDFEKKSLLCQAEMKFQLDCLHGLESGRKVESALFSRYHFPP